jgi:hypothetical protein
MTHHAGAQLGHGRQRPLPPDQGVPHHDEFIQGEHGGELAPDIDRCGHPITADGDHAHGAWSRMMRDGPTHALASRRVVDTDVNHTGRREPPGEWKAE